MQTRSSARARKDGQSDVNAPSTAAENTLASRIICPFPGPKSEAKQLDSCNAWMAMGSNWQGQCNVGRPFYYRYGFSNAGLSEIQNIPDAVLLPDGCLHDRPHLVAIACEFILKQVREMSPEQVAQRNPLQVG